MSNPFQVPETIYPYAVPMLPCRDIDATLGFFENLLGFRRSFAHGAPIEYAGMKRDGAEIHFFRCDEPKLLELSGCRIRVDGIDPLYTRCMNRGVVHPDGKLAEKPWGTREFVMLDPDGVMVTFFEQRLA